MRVPLVAQVDPQEPASSGADTAQAEQWSAAQAAAVAAAEAIAATAAAEVAAEAAATAQAAVDVASAAAVKAAAKADEVAARAALAATAAALEPLRPESGSDQSGGSRAGVTTTGDVLLAGETPTGAASSAVMVDPAAAAAAAAAAKVAVRVAAVAAAAATAAVEAAALIREQLVKDVGAAAVAVAAAAHPVLAEHAETLALSCDATRAGHTDIGACTPVPVVAPGELALAEELRRGIAANQLCLHYQPIMNLATGRPVGVEALVRWQHPARGLLGPLEFVELAERTELILPLGAWVLHEACRVAVRLQNRSAGPFTVAVNLSARQLSDRGLVPTVRAALSVSMG